MSCKIMYVLYGIPASGKSTFRTEMKIPYTNKDEIREEQQNKKEARILEIENEQIKEYCLSGVDFIIDNTNLHPKHIMRYEFFAREYGYEIVHKFMEDSWNVELCHKRNINRGVRVPVEVIERMAEDYVAAWWKHHIGDMPNQIIANRDCIIVDIDGTIARNVSRGWFEWERVGEDIPVWGVVELVKFYKEQKGCRVIMLSGRDGVCRPETEAWLAKYKIPCDELHMRAKGSMEKDVLVKRDLYRKHIYGDYNVVAVFDDRQQVCRLWRGLGLPLFQVGSKPFF